MFQNVKSNYMYYVSNINILSNLNQCDSVCFFVPSPLSGLIPVFLWSFVQFVLLHLGHYSLSLFIYNKKRFWIIQADLFLGHLSIEWILIESRSCSKTTKKLFKVFLGHIYAVIYQSHLRIICIYKHHM